MDNSSSGLILFLVGVEAVLIMVVMASQFYFLNLRIDEILTNQEAIITILNNTGGIT